METRKLVGMRIKGLRRGRGYSQEKLAEVTGINAKYLSSIERGEENPTLDLFIRLSQGLKSIYTKCSTLNTKTSHLRLFEKNSRLCLETSKIRI